MVEDHDADGTSHLGDQLFGFRATEHARLRRRKSKRRTFGAGRVEWRCVVGLGVAVGDLSIGIEAADALGLDLGRREHPVLVLTMSPRRGVGTARRSSSSSGESTSAAWPLAGAWAAW